jgi:hypothetical protein
MDDVDDDDLNIYINNKEDIIEDELITYLKEKRLNKKVSKSYLFHFKIS